MYSFRNDAYTMNWQRSVMERYERGEEKISLAQRGFMYSYGDDIKTETKTKKTKTKRKGKNEPRDPKACKKQKN